MMSTLQHPLVLDYLARLEAAAASLSSTSRAELVSDIGAHIEEAAAHTDGSDEAIRQVLDRLGPPEDAAREAGASAVRPGPAAQDRGPVLEMWALALLVGSVLMCLSVILLAVAPLALIAGLVLLFLSKRWSLRDKLQGAAVYGLGGVPLVIVAASLSFVSTQSCTGGTSSDGSTWEECTGGTAAWAPWLAIALGVGMLALWTWTAVRLYRTAWAGNDSRARTGSLWLLVALLIGLVLFVLLVLAPLGVAGFMTSESTSTDGSAPVVVIR